MLITPLIRYDCDKCFTTSSACSNFRGIVMPAHN